MNYNIGIIGGGQLGMMMIQEVKKLNLTTIVLDPSPICPCSFVADKLIVGSFNDVDKLIELGDQCSLLSYEFENVDGKTLSLLNEKYKIPQGIKPLLDSQDRLIEKDNANRNGLPTVRYRKIDTMEDLIDAASEIGYPLIYKTRRNGYDGHGQEVIHSQDDFKKVLPYLEKKIQGIVEEKLSFDFECSIVMIRDKEKIIHFPIGQNIHKDGILDVSIVPCKLDPSLEKELIKKSEEFMIEANYYGILTIEYFVKGKQFYFNEMAPRPHNSGHYTIEGCNTNQFLELDKFLMGLPLKQPELIYPTIMKNILGRDMKDVNTLIQLKNAHLHMYNKQDESPLRKLGHITFTDMTYEEYLELRQQH